MYFGFEFFFRIKNGIYVKKTYSALKLTYHNCCITAGCTSGIGTETARTLALRNAHVVMANRNQEQSMKLRDRIRAEMVVQNLLLLYNEA